MPALLSPSNSSTKIIEESGRVLLLLDTQQCILASTTRGGIPDVESTSNNIKRILDTARNAQPPPLIIHVRNTGDIGDMDEPDAPGWQLIFSPQINEVVIDKRKNNAFAGTSLGDIVPTTAEIIIVGFQTDFSIRATCSAALGRGNEVLLVHGAHKTYPRIEVLHGGGVTSAEQVVTEMESELTEEGVHLLEMEDVEHMFDCRE